MIAEELVNACPETCERPSLRHALEVPEPNLCRGFHPFGFKTLFRTNDARALQLADESWGMFRLRFNNPPIRVNVHVLEGGALACPPEPRYHLMGHMLVSISDQQNFCVVDLLRSTTEILVTCASLAQNLWFRQFMLEGAASCHIATRYATPVHAACVAIDDKALLLCGDSGAGKSTLAYACALAGWQYISDDACFLINGSNCHQVVGNCHQFRLRPSAGELFPELRDLPLTPRAAGKPSMVVPSSALPNVSCSESAAIQAIVFLNRSNSDDVTLTPKLKEAARDSMRQVLFGVPEIMREQFRSIDRLLTIPVYELRYRALGPAIARLRSLLQEGG